MLMPDFMQAVQYFLCTILLLIHVFHISCSHAEALFGPLSAKRPYFRTCMCTLYVHCRFVFGASENVTAHSTYQAVVLVL